MAEASKTSQDKAGAAGWRSAIALALIGLTVTGVAVPAQASSAPAAQQDAGRRLFVRCVACHSLRETPMRMTGPHLAGIVGRPVASVPGFRYTEALRSRSFVWDEARLDLWLRAPQADIPGLCLPFTGFAKSSDRRAMIAYLRAYRAD